MLRKFLHEGREFEYEYKVFRNAKSIKIIIRPDGRLLVTAPKSASQKFISDFIARKKDWIGEQLKRLPRRKNNEREAKAEYEKYKLAAREMIIERLEHFNQRYNFVFKKISIRNQSSRWGSCSKSGNLSFNYKLALLPPALADYVIVHELCHLKEFNHSPRFWKLVEVALPDYKLRRKALKVEKSLIK
jgi:predicted metal-dependent hydrolase